HLFSLKKDGILKAVVMVNISDIGLNLADLTNCIKVIVIDSDDLPKDVLNLMFSKLSPKFEQNEIPVLIYPVSYAEKESIPYEKSYNLWALDMKHTDLYFKHLNRLFEGSNS
ncbi:MAG: PilZ domain-containing protein, partial [Deltaproteobacteria bacterium]|nr:PilZ domain-containing protein [Deltaproteobacteria bacterium]